MTRKAFALLVHSSKKSESLGNIAAPSFSIFSRINPFSKATLAIDPNPSR